MQKIYVMGHKNPDTDSVCSAIVYADYLNTKGMEAQAVILGEINNETKFVLDHFGIAQPELVTTLPAGSQVVLVDHNELSQSIDNLSELDLVGVIDHHKFGNFSTSKPVFVQAEPLCSTASVMFNIFEFEGFEPSEKMAGLMIAQIISDSLFFRSPTSTDYDKEILELLNEIAQIDNLEDFANQMFQAKSDLGDISVSDLIQLDYKEFDFNGKKTGIGVIETVNPDYSLGRKDEILKGMQEIKSSHGLDLIFLSVIDIINERNLTFVIGDAEAEVLKGIYGAETKDNIADLGNVISRKKQVVPQFTEYFNK